MNCPICNYDLSHFSGDMYVCPNCVSQFGKTIFEAGDWWYELREDGWYQGYDPMHKLPVKEFKRKVSSAKLIGRFPSQ